MDAFVVTEQQKQEVCYNLTLQNRFRCIIWTGVVCKFKNYLNAFRLSSSFILRYLLVFIVCLLLLFYMQNIPCCHGYLMVLETVDVYSHNNNN